MSERWIGRSDHMTNATSPIFFEQQVVPIRQPIGSENYDQIAGRKCPQMPNIVMFFIYDLHTAKA